MLLEGRAVSLGDHPDSMITEVYLLLNGKSVHVIVGEEVQESCLIYKESLIGRLYSPLSGLIRSCKHSSAPTNLKL